MKKKTKSLLALMLVLLMLLSIAGCGGGSNSSGSNTTNNQQSQTDDSGPAPATNDSDEDDSKQNEQPTENDQDRDVVISLASDVSSLYCYDRGSYINNQVLWHPYEALITKNATMEFVPLLAESWEISDDGMSWTFHLRKGVKFHDGSDFTAEDVISSYDRARVPGESLFVERFVYVDSYEATDDYTVVVHTTIPQPLLLDDLMFIVISNKDDIERKTPEEIAANINGTGRYKFVEYVPEDHIDFTVNEDYWGEIPEVRNVRFRPISNTATRTASLLSGELDVAFMLNIYDIDRINNTDGVRVELGRSMECVSIQMLQTDENPAVALDVNPFQDVRVRKAMYMAIDAEAIVENIYNGHAYLTTTTVAQDFNGFDPDLQRLPYDPEAAKELLTEAGYPDGFEVTFDVSASSPPNAAELAQALASYWEKIGIKVDLNLMSTGFGTYVNQSAGNSGLMISPWAIYTGDGVSMQEKQYHTWDEAAGTGGGNYSQYSNPEVDAMIEEAMQEMDADKRAELIRQIDQKAAIEEVANIPLFFNENVFGVNDSLEYTPRYDRYVLAWEIHYK